MSYPLPLKAENSNLYGSVFAHLARLFTNVDDVPRPQSLLKLSFVKNLFPSISFTSFAFSKYLFFKKFIKTFKFKI